jgi:pyruvate/2-oxoglutarate dehydrogenase complex dihydrolipoamide dehydrogenase (E3) component
MRFDVLVLGSGSIGKLIACHMARLGQRTAVVERQWIGGACPNIACMPSKNEIRSAELAHLARHAAEFGTMTNAVVRRYGLGKLQSERRRIDHPPYGRLADAILAHPTMAEGLRMLFSSVPRRSIQHLAPERAA